LTKKLWKTQYEWTTGVTGESVDISITSAYSVYWWNVQNCDY